jgi:hypothetical protein
MHSDGGEPRAYPRGTETKHRFFLVLLLALFPSLLPAQLAPRTPTGSIVGRVVGTANGADIEGVRVEVLSTGQAVTWGTLGRYLLDSVPVGARRGRATAIEFEPVVLTDTPVGSGKTLELELRLFPRGLDHPASLESVAYARFRGERHRRGQVLLLGREPAAHSNG